MGSSLELCALVAKGSYDREHLLIVYLVVELGGRHALREIRYRVLELVVAELREHSSHYPVRGVSLESGLAFGVVVS